MATLDELADELYALPPAEFVSGRAAVVAAARAGGDRATAAALAALRKPTVTAWLANQLVRTEPDLVAGALAVGPALREATVSGDRAALRDLSRHRGALLVELGSAARAIAAEHDQAFTAGTERELEQTFTAAAADPTAAEALLSGRLVGALESAGLGFELGAIPPDRPAPGPGAATGEAALPEADSEASERAEARVTTRAPTGRSTTRSIPVGDRRDDRAEALARAREEADQALAEARLQDADATTALAAAQEALDDAVAAEKAAAEAHRAAKAELSDARADLTAAKADATATGRAVAAALAALERLDRA